MRGVELLRRLLGFGPERQSGAIPYRHTDRGTEFLLVTSRRTQRWIFPKGGLNPGQTPAESAAAEAWEEAGVRGRIADAPAGHYDTVKLRDGRLVPVRVDMYPLEVAEELDCWPEQAMRERRWASAAEAIGLLSEPGLCALAEQVARSLSR